MRNIYIFQTKQILKRLKIIEAQIKDTRNEIYKTYLDPYNQDTTITEDPGIHYAELNLNSALSSIQSAIKHTEHALLRLERKPIKT